MKLYVSIVDFQVHLPNTLSNTKMVYMLNIDFDEWNNIGIVDFSIQDHLGFRKPMLGYKFFQNSKLSGSNFSKWKYYAKYLIYYTINNV